MRILDHCPKFKDSSRFLHLESLHPNSIHLAWPAAYLRTLWKISSSVDNFEQARQIFVQRLRDSQFPEWYLEWLVSKSFYFLPYHTVDRAQGAKMRSNVIWQPVDYNPLAAKKISSAMQRYVQSTLSQTLLANTFDVPPGVRLAWRLVGRPFAASLIRW